MSLSLVKNWNLFSAVILVLSAAWVWASAVPTGGTSFSQIPAPRAGFPAPDFVLETPEGASVRLSDLRGQAVLINFWATWCPPCVAEMPAIEAVYQDYQAQGFVVLAVNAIRQDDPNKVTAFMGEHKLSFPVLYDPVEEVSRLYQVRSLPTSFFIDPQGIIQKVVVGGPMSETLLRMQVEAMLPGGK